MSIVIHKHLKAYDRLRTELLTLKAVVTDTTAGPMSLEMYHRHQLTLSTLDRELQERLVGMVSGFTDDEQDAGLALASQLLDCSKTVALALAIHGREAGALIQNNGPNRGTLHVHVSGGPFVGKYHLTALLWKFFHELSYVIGHNPQSIRLKNPPVKVEAVVSEEDGFNLFCEEMDALTIEQLLDEPSEVTTYPGLERIVISADDVAPEWYRYTQPSEAAAIANLRELRPSPIPKK